MLFVGVDCFVGFYAVFDAVFVLFWCCVLCCLMLFDAVFMCC